MSESSTSFGNLALLGGLDLAHPLAQLGRDIGKAERRENLPLLVRAQALAARGLFLRGALPRGRDEPPFAQVHAPVEGALAHLHVVVLRAREMMEREGKLAFWDNPHVGLKPSRESDTRLCLPFRRHLGHTGLAGKPVDRGRHVARRDYEVEVADRLEAPPEAPGRLGARDLREGPEPGEDGAGGLVRVPPEVPLCVGLPVANSSENLLLRLFPEPGQRRDPPVPARLLKVRDRRNPELAADCRDLLRAEPRNL